MLFTIFIYLYAATLVIGSLVPLQKAKRQFKLPNNHLYNEEIFHIPSKVSQKVIKRTGTTVHVNGKEKLLDEPVLYVANHQGLFDILAFLGHLGKPVGFVAKKEINKLPIIRKWMELLYCVFIDRNDRRQSMKAINQGIENLKAGHSLVIFPEGTRSRGSILNEFKSGSLRLATKANVPIIPVSIDGTYKMLEEGNGRIQASEIKMTINDPIYPDDYKDLKSGELASLIQRTIEKSLGLEQEESMKVEMIEIS
ncbi:1-acylglycerol-3-phosphate O-acyltransferase [Ornithinibacillus sp. L9]|uniref:1-acyl-sn-glycerol-3-phosphate acyltransferase n=1 Tax=Ornithinibacillus caprae TaxID=2678566 RepID=A0A6N8FFT3_9BACI|nr:lysophospholipid acyltransferase family protein [Ornithinibacillus caprae]MUK88363.1 1-acylglycerol-3-phosphate O-acyltransferase [Ornithinibacillus caprae]